LYAWRPGRPQSCPSPASHGPRSTCRLRLSAPGTSNRTAAQNISSSCRVLRSALGRRGRVAEGALGGAEGAGRDRRGDRRCAQGGTEGGDLAEEPEQRRAEGQDAGGEALDLVLAHEPEVDRIGQQHADHDTGGCQNEVLDL